MLLAGGGRRSGFAVGGAIEGGVSFTDNVSSFIHQNSWLIEGGYRWIRIPFETVADEVTPVVYIGTGDQAKDARQRESVEAAEGVPTRSLYFVREEEWWSPNDVPLTEFDVSLKMTKW